MSRLTTAAAILLLSASNVAADIVITETTTAKMGGRTAQGLRSTSIKDSQMRIELLQGSDSKTTLFDLPAGTVSELDAGKKRAEIRDMGARAADLERQYPRHRVAVTVAPTGAARELAGSPCAEYTFAIKVPMTKDDEPAMNMTGSAWIATDGPGADDYQNFAKAADRAQLVLGYVSSNKILLAIARAQTELYRALSDVHGIPYLIEMTIQFDGHGMLTGFMNKVASGSRTTTVTNVAVGPIDGERFLVPGGWKRDKK